MKPNDDQGHAGRAGKHDLGEDRHTRGTVDPSRILSSGGSDRKKLRRMKTERHGCRGVDETMPAAVYDAEIAPP
jgi:hypothetical protein